MEKERGHDGSRQANAWMDEWYEYFVDSMQRFIIFMDMKREYQNSA